MCHNKKILLKLRAFKVVDPLQQRLRLRFLAEVHPENILDSQMEYIFDCL